MEEPTGWNVWITEPGYMAYNEFFSRKEGYTYNDVQAYADALTSVYKYKATVTITYALRGGDYSEKELISRVISKNIASIIDDEQDYINFGVINE